MDFLYDVAVAAIIKNEGPYLAEWLDYHERAGIDHFFLYDNDSTDDTQSILRPYIERGYVTLIRLSGRYQQLSAYHDAVHRFRYLCRYMVLIDADEFLYPLQGKNIPTVVLGLMMSHSDWGGLAVNWSMFGSSGYKSPQDYHGVLQSFLYRKAHYDTTIKSIVNPRMVEYFMNPHSARYYPLIQAHDVRGAVVYGSSAAAYEDACLVLNHYVTKSEAEWMARHSRLPADGGNPPADMLKTYQELDCNDKYDDGLARFSASLKAPHIDYQQQRKEYIAAVAERMTGFLSSSSPDITETLQYFYLARDLLAEFLSEKERQALLRSMIQQLYTALEGNTLGMQSICRLMSALPDILIVCPRAMRHRLTDRLSQILTGLCTYCREQGMIYHINQNGTAESNPEIPYYEHMAHFLQAFSDD